MDAETLAAEVRKRFWTCHWTHDERHPFAIPVEGCPDCKTVLAADAALDSLVALAARVPQLEAERDEAKRALYDRDEYSRKTRCDCHETSMGDPDYTPAFQDEYQRLWHESRARVAQLETALATIRDRHFGDTHGSADGEIARAALEQTP